MFKASCQGTVRDKTRFQHLIIDRFMEIFMKKLKEEDERQGEDGRILAITERSLRTNVEIFIEREVELGNVDEIDGALLSWKSRAFHDLIIRQYKMSVLYVYLKSSPDKCLERIRSRGRPEEQTIHLEHLEELHTRHERLYRRLEAEDEKTLILNVDRLTYPDRPKDEEIMISVIVDEIRKFMDRHRYTVA